MSRANDVPVAAGGLYLEDLRVGHRFTSGEYRMEGAAMKAFAAQFDPQPFHVDEAAAEHSLFGGLAASGWHTAAATMRLLTGGGLPLAGGLIGVAADMKWPVPVRPGDSLTVTSEVLAIAPSRSKPNCGIVKIRCTTRNQNGESVQIGVMQVLVFRRPPLPAQTE